MGTRGFTGFVIDGTEKISYQQFDSYPDGVGIEVLRWLREAVKSPQALGKLARDLRVVRDNTPVTIEDIEKLARYTDLGVSRQSPDDWYCLLRETQGKPGLMLESGYLLDAADFPGDSLFCEYGYLIDLDGDGWFEVYRGFQKQDHGKGRFASRQRREDWTPQYEGESYYAPVALWQRWPLTALPSDKEFLAALDESTPDPAAIEARGY